MSFNRNKILANAQKLLQKGKVSEAIHDYEEVVRNDPSDIRTLLKIGDLHAKQGNIEGATSTYQKVGEFYAKDGFFLKAVAVFKQILKLDPGLILVYVRLAQLYQNLGLNSDAIKQYQVVARHYESQGLIKESLDILQKMSELEPDNILNRVKLAELYCREGHKEEGKKQFFSIVTLMESKKNYPELVCVYEKILALDIQGEDIELKAVEAYLSNSEPKKALIRLQKLFQKSPRDVNVLNLLAQCFLDLAQPEKSKSVYVEILNILEKENRNDEKDRFVAKLRTLNVVSQSPTSAGSPDTYSIPNSVSEVVPAEKSIAKILEELDTFMQYGLLEKAVRLLEESIASNLDDSELRSRFFSVAKDCERTQVDPSLNRLIDAARQAQKLDVQKEFENYRREAFANEAMPELEIEKIEEVSAPRTEEFERIDDEVSLDLSQNFSLPSEEKSALDDIAFDLNDDPQIAESVEFVLQNEEVEAESMAPIPAMPDSIPEMNVSSAINPEMSMSVELESQYQAPVETSFVDFSLDSEPQGEFVPMDIVIEAPAVDVAPIPEPTPPPTLEMKPTVEALMARALAFADAGEGDKAKDMYIAILVQDRSYAPALEALTRLSSPAPVQVAPPTQNTSTKASPPPMQSASDLFDLSSELQDEIHELETELSHTKNPDEAYLSPEEVISEFKKGVARTVAKDDYQTHYNLGIAYKEMGLLDEAISEFEAARVDAALLMPAVSMIGHCLMGKREFAQAISLYKKALQEMPPVKSPEVMGLTYELAEAFVGAGYVGEAGKLFAKVAEFDPTYRDAKIRAKELEESKVASLDKMPKKNKVSYI